MILAFLLVVFSIANLTTGCKSKSPPQGSTANNSSQAGPQTAPQLSIDDLVAPIALYPDQLLAQVLAVAVNPQEVLDLGNWLLQNQNLQGDAMTNAAKQAGFSPSAQYLALFPQVVDNMCQQLNWTRQLGEAFKSNQAAVMDAVQRKRMQAQQMGNLNSSPQMKVENKKADNGEKYVAIQPADPKVVYVPQYNPVTIYNTQAPAAPAQTTTTTSSEEKDGVSTGAVLGIGLLSFGIGMAVGSAINNDYYYPYPAWGYSSVYVGRAPYYPAAYRAPVYAGYRPAYGYNPPGNYRWNQYNRNMNVNVNNNYYNRFNNTNASTRAGNTRQAYQGRTQSADARPLQNQSSWKGQSTYQGARSSRAGERPGASMANAIPRSQQYGERSSSNQLAANRASAGSMNTAADRAYGGGLGSGAGAPSLDANRASAATLNRGGDRGYGSGASSFSTRAANSSGESFHRSASSSAAAQSRDTGGAFGGGDFSGRQERAASSRGRASFGGGGRGGRRGR